MQNITAKNQVFISYRRTDGEENIKNLEDSFEKCSGLNAFVDVNELRSGNFIERLRAVISDCYVFMPIVTTDYIKFAFERGRDVEGDFCLKEYRAALLSKKKIVPVFVNISGSGREVSYDEAKTAAQALVSTDPAVQKESLETLKAYLFTQNGVWVRSFSDWSSECAEKLSEIVFDCFCDSADIPFYKEYLASRVDALNPRTVFGDFTDLALTVKNSFVSLDLVRQLTEKEKHNPDLKPVVLSCWELEKRIREDGLAVIVGDAGQGKSTIAKKLFIELAEVAAQYGLSRDKLFPLFYECRGLKAEALKKEKDFITELAHDAGLKPASIRQIMRYGQPLFIFDALDEIAPEQGDALLKAINNYLCKDGKLPHILFTSRPGQKHVAGYGDMTIDHTENTTVRRYTVNALTREQRDRYISILAESARSGEDKKQDIIRGLDRKECEVAGYTELSRNPFLLFALFGTFGSEKDLPDTYFDAVSRIIEDVIRRDLGKDAYEHLGVDEIRSVLGALAYGIYTDRDGGRLPTADAERAVNCAMKLFGLYGTDRNERETINEYRSFFGSSRLFDRSGFQHEFLASAYAAYYLRLLIRRKVAKGCSPAKCRELSSLKNGADYWKSVEKALLILLDRESADSKEFVEPVLNEMQDTSPDYDTICAAVGQFRQHLPRASTLLLQKMLERGCCWIAAHRSPDDVSAYPGEANPYEELFYYPAVFPYLKQYLANLTPQGEADEAFYVEIELIKEVQALFSENPHETLTQLYEARKECHFSDLTELLARAAGKRRGKDLKGYLRIAEGVSAISEYAFASYTGLTSVIFPESLTAIYEGAFYCCIKLTSVIIPKGVSEIGYSAFKCCSGLECLKVVKTNNVFYSENNCIIDTTKKELILGCKNSNIPAEDTVEKIGRDAFYGCSGLISVTIPKKVCEICKGAFSECEGLESLNVTEGNSFFYSKNNCIIDTAKKELILGCKNSVIPDDGSVERIGREAFFGCTGLINLNIPESVSEIGAWAFSSCIGLTSVIIPKSVREINDDTFSYCTGLTSITIPESVKKIGAWAFSECVGLTSVTISGDDCKIGEHAFFGCTGLENLNIMNGVSDIGYCAFKCCSGLKSATLPESVSEIGSGAFSKCTGLVNLIVTGGVRKIGADAFSDCTGLTSVNIPEGIREIGANAFSGCVGLTSVIIPESVCEIISGAFSGCTRLEYLNVSEKNSVFHSDNNCIICTAKKELVVGCKNSVIPVDGSVVTIGDRSFESCFGLESVTIPESVNKIGESAFSYCTGIKNMTIPEGVIKISKNAFKCCSRLSSVIIREGVREIDDSAFEGCTGLLSVTIPNSVSEISCVAFKGCIGLEYLNVSGKNSVFHSEGNCIICTAKKEIVIGCKTSVIPSDGSVVRIGQGAFEGCTAKTFLIIPEEVRIIGRGAFLGCTGLSSVTIPESVSEIGMMLFSGCVNLTSVFIPKNVTEIGFGAFKNCERLSLIFYSGSEEEWRKISIDDFNEPLLKARIVFNYQPG